MKKNYNMKTILLCPVCGNEVTFNKKYNDVICPWCKTRSLKKDVVREKVKK